jgi:hypothetical protein
MTLHSKIDYFDPSNDVIHFHILTPFSFAFFTYPLVFYPVAEIIAYYVYCILTISFCRAFACD